jgi:hypothetical protein
MNEQQQQQQQKFSLERALKKSGYKTSFVAEALGMSRQYFHVVRKKKFTNLSDKFVRNIAVFFGADYEAVKNWSKK